MIGIHDYPPAKQDNMNRSKQCRVCGTREVLDNFPKDARAKDGHAHECTRCRESKKATALIATLDAAPQEPEAIILDRKTVPISTEVKQLRIENQILRHELHIRDLKLEVLRSRSAINDLKE